MKIYYNFCLFLLFGTLFIGNVLCQTAVTPFQIKPSELFEKLAEYKTKNPETETKLIVDKANELLIDEGLNFIFTFNAETCKKIKEFLNNEKNKGKPILLRATLQSLGGEKVSVILPEPLTDSSSCNSCRVKVPLHEIRDDKFIANIRGKHMKFVLPDNFNLHKVSLFEKNVLETSNKSWVIPSKLTPISISPDSSVVYFDLADPRFDDLAMAFYSNGIFQFFAKNELVLIDKTKSIDSAKSIESDISYFSLGEEDEKKTFKFQNPCDYVL